MYNLKRNSWITKLYKWTYDKEDLPDNFCPYFWKSLVAFVMFPLLWLSFPISYIGFWRRLFVSLGIITIFIIVGGLIGLSLAGIYTPLLVIALFSVVILGMAIVISLIFGVIYTVEVGYDKIIHSEAVKMIRNKKESFKDKYCPKIHWMK